MNGIRGTYSSGNDSGRDHERDVLDGAGIPRGWGCEWNAEKIVTCAPPVVSSSPKKE